MTPIIYSNRMFTGKSSKPSGMIGRKNHALQEPPVVPYKALYGTTGGSSNARFFSHVMMGGTPAAACKALDQRFVVYKLFFPRGLLHIFIAYSVNLLLVYIFHLFF